MGGMGWAWGRCRCAGLGAGSVFKLLDHRSVILSVMFMNYECNHRSLIAIMISYSITCQTNCPVAGFMFTLKKILNKLILWLIQ